MHWFESKNTKTSLRKHENKAFLKYYELKSSQNFPPPAESGRGMFFFGDFSNIWGRTCPFEIHDLRFSKFISGEFHLRKPPVIRKPPPLVAPRSGTRGGFLITPPEAENFCKYKCIINSAGGENCYKKAPSYKKAPPLVIPRFGTTGGFLKGPLYLKKTLNVFSV